jgi:hypothetical protein
MALPRKRREIFSRRGGGGIRVWDMGYVLDGDEYVTLPYIDPYSADPIGHVTTVAPGWMDFDLLSSAHYVPIHEAVLAYPTEEWTETFKQIDNTYLTTYGAAPLVSYRGRLYDLGDSDVWDGDRFLPNQSALNTSFAAQLESRFFSGFGAGGAFSNRITAEPDFAADEVTFIPSNTMDVFMVPNLMQARLESIHALNLGTGEYTSDGLDFLRVIYPREVIHDSDLGIYQYDLEGNAFDYTNGDPAEDYEPIYNITEYWRENYAFRALRGESLDFLPDVITEIDPALYAPGFPAPPTLPSYPTAVSLFGQFITEDPLAGNLTAVIKKGSTYYYFWQD